MSVAENFMLADRDPWKYAINKHYCPYVYWTVHHCDSWRIRDQLEVTSYYVLFHFFYAQHVSDINTAISRILRLFYCIAALVVCSVKMKIFNISVNSSI